MVSPELDGLFRDLMATNRGPGYGITVVDAASDLSVIRVDLRFRAGFTYCCAEPLCHLSTDRTMLRFRDLARKRRMQLPEAIAIHWHFYVEAGAILTDLAAFGLSPESKGYDFEVTFGDTDEN